MRLRPDIRLLPAAAICLGAVLAGCAGTGPAPAPPEILNPPPGDLQLVEAAQAPQRHIGSRVRWGGSIITVDRDARGNARVEVIQRRLDEEGRPLGGSPSDGRFVILAAPSVDPDLYARGGEITVAGRLEPPVEGRIGDAPARFPVVRVEQFVRWEPRWRDYPYYPDPWYPWDPWYGPRFRFGVGVGTGYYHPYPGYWYRPPYAW